MNSSSEEVYYRELKCNHNRNTLWSIIDSCFYNAGFACILPSVILVAFLMHYTKNQTILNLPVIITNFSSAFFPFITSFFSGRFISKKKPLIIMAGMGRSTWVLITAVTFMYFKASAIFLTLFFILFFIYNVFEGSASFYWQEFMGRSLHPDKRSTSLGLRSSISNMFAFATSFLVVYILQSSNFPVNYQILFAIAVLGGAGSLFCLSMIKEAPYSKILNENPYSHLKNIIRLPVENKTFGVYIVFSLFLNGFSFIGGLFTTVGLERFSKVLNRDLMTGMMTVVSLFSSAVLSLVISRIFEKKGKYFTFLLVSICMMPIPLWAIACMNEYLFMSVFIFNGFLTAAWLMDFNTILDFSPPEKRHEYIAFNSIIKLISIMIYMNLGGLIADKFSPAITFIITSVFLIVAIIILIWKLGPLWGNVKLIKQL